MFSGGDWVRERVHWVRMSKHKLTDIDIVLMILAKTNSTTDVSAIGNYPIFLLFISWEKFGNFLIKLCSSNSSFNGNILISLYYKIQSTSAKADCRLQLLITSIIYKFDDMIWTWNFHWRYILINEVCQWFYDFFYKRNLVCKLYNVLSAKFITYSGL